MSLEELPSLAHVKQKKMSLMPLGKDFIKEDLKSPLWFLLEVQLPQITFSGSPSSQIRVLGVTAVGVTFWDLTAVGWGC